MNQINSVDDEIYIFGDFNKNLFLNDFYILEKNNILTASQFQVMLKATMNFAHFLD